MPRPWSASSPAAPPVAADSLLVEQLCQPLVFAWVHRSPITGFEAIQAQGRIAIHQIDAAAQQSQGWESDGGGHPTDLTVAAFSQGDLKPVGWDGFAEADRRVTFGQSRNGIPFQPSHLSRKGLPALD